MAENIQILDLHFQPYISAEEIDSAVSRIAADIDSKYFESDNPPVFICILNGSFVFSSDLMKKVKTSSQIEFVRLKSYQGTQSTENVQEVLGLEIDLQGRDVIVLEDIVDTGHTLDKFLKTLQTYKPRSVEIASLIFKKEAFKKSFKIDYLGFEIENKFIVGYGLDYNEYGRNIPEIYQIVHSNEII